MRIVYLGSGAFGLPTLAALAAEHTLTGIVTQPDRPAGRGGKPTPTPVAQWAARHAADLSPETQLLKPDRINDRGWTDRVRALDADAWVVIAFGQKLGRGLIADRFACNLHASLLPRWRGAAPINAAVLAGDTRTGNTVITIADRMDAGLILGRSQRPIEPHQTAGELHDLLAGDGPALMLDVLARHARGESVEIMGEEQQEDLVTLAPKLSKADAWIDFADTADACRARVHGLTPWPGVAVEHAGTRFKILRTAAETAPDLANAPPGTQPGTQPSTLIDAQQGLVACGSGALRLLDVQPEGGRAMTWAQFANGRAVRAGEPVITTRPVPDRNTGPGAKQ